MTIRPIDTASPIELMDWAIRARPAAIVCDIDGTIAPIAASPGAARLTPGAREALIELTKLVDVVAAVTGRSATDGAAMIGIPAMLVVGNHGLEWLKDGEREIDPAAVAAVPRIQEALTEIAVVVSHDPDLHGTYVEDKTLSGSIHYRQTADHIVSFQKLYALASVVAERHGLKLTEGRLVIELRPPVDINKGAALLRIIAQHQLNGMVFLGDDVTDVDGFRVLSNLRAERDFAGVSIAVSDPEAKPDVVKAADTSVSGVPACVELLTSFAQRLRQER